MKWSDRPAKDRKLLRHLGAFRARHPTLSDCEVTTRTVLGKETLSDGSTVFFVPTSLAVYVGGKFLLELNRFGREDG